MFDKLKKKVAEFFGRRNEDEDRIHKWAREIIDVARTDYLRDPTKSFLEHLDHYSRYRLMFCSGDRLAEVHAAIKRVLESEAKFGREYIEMMVGEWRAGNWDKVLGEINGLDPQTAALVGIRIYNYMGSQWDTNGSVRFMDALVSRDLERERLQLAEDAIAKQIEMTGWEAGNVTEGPVMDNGHRCGIVHPVEAVATCKCCGATAKSTDVGEFHIGRYFAWKLAKKGWAYSAKHDGPICPTCSALAPIPDFDEVKPGSGLADEPEA